MRDTKNNRTAPRRTASQAAQRTREQQSREQNARRHKRRRSGNHALLYGIILVMMFSIGLTLIFTVFFKVKSVQAAGVTRYAPEQVALSSGITEGMNMLRLNREGISRNLMKQYSYFESVRIRLKLPDTVVIQATEAVPVAAIQQGGAYLLFSKSYRVLETAAPVLPDGIPVIKGFSAMTLKAGEQIDGTGQEKIEVLSNRISELEKEYARDLEKGKKDTAAQKQSELDNLRQQLTLLTNEWDQRKNQLRALEAFMAASTEVGLTQIQYIDVSDPYNLSAGYDGRVVLALGSESELSYKMLMAKKVLEEECEPGFSGTLDVSIPHKAFARPGDPLAGGSSSVEPAEQLSSQTDSSADFSGGADENSDQELVNTASGPGREPVSGENT